MEQRELQFPTCPPRTAGPGRKGGGCLLRGAGKGVLAATQSSLTPARAGAGGYPITQVKVYVQAPHLATADEGCPFPVLQPEEQASPGGFF